MSTTAIQKSTLPQTLRHVSDTDMVLDALGKMSKPLTLVRLSLDLALDPMLAEHSRTILRDGLEAAETALRVLHLLRETLETSLPQCEAEPVDLSGALRSALLGMRESSRFQFQMRGSVPVLATWKALQVSLGCLLPACIRYARATSPITLKVGFEIDHVLLRFGLELAAGVEPKFHLLSGFGEGDDLVLARALVQSFGGDLTLEPLGGRCTLVLRLPLATIDVAGVQ